MLIQRKRSKIQQSHLISIQLLNIFKCISLIFKSDDKVVLFVCLFRWSPLILYVLRQLRVEGCNTNRKKYAPISELFISRSIFDLWDDDDELQLRICVTLRNKKYIVTTVGGVSTNKAPSRTQKRISMETKQRKINQKASKQKKNL